MLASPELGKEYPPPNEDEYIERIVEFSEHSLRGAPHPPSLRDQHPKSHGCLKARFSIMEQLPENLRYGVFQPGRTYEAWIRFSNSTNRRQKGKLMPDTAPDARGMAIKLLNIEGPKLIDDETHSSVQDLIFINHPCFFIKNVEDYTKFFPVVKAMREGKIIVEPGQPPQIPEEFREDFTAIAYAFKILKKIQGQNTTNPIDISYYSATPFKLGPHAIKFAVMPHQSNTFNPDEAKDPDNYLREALRSYLSNQDAKFDFMVQLQTDPEKMCIEDSTIEWSQDESPFIKVGAIEIPSQEFDTEERKALDEKLAFSPWHSLEEHRPLGGVNRARKKVYDTLAELRRKLNKKASS